MSEFREKFVYGAVDFEISVKSHGGGVCVGITKNGNKVINLTVPTPMLAGYLLKLPDQHAFKIEDELNKIL